MRVNKAGCLDRCAGGPVAVVYPEGTWYTYVDHDDIDEIVESHLKQGRVVERLLLAPTSAADGRPRMNPRTRRSADRRPGRRASNAPSTTRSSGAPRGLAVLCHPHPLHGGTMDNKVVQTLARALRGAGLQRGALQLPRRRRLGRRLGRGPRRGRRRAGGDRRAHRAPGQPLVLGGFSFGGYVASQAAARLPDGGTRPSAWCWSARRCATFAMAAGAADTLVIHGEADEVVPLAAVLDWARPQALPVTVVPGAGHFFHGQLTLLKHIVTGAWHPRAPT